MNNNFEINETFKITNRGIVLLGSFVSGIDSIQVYNGYKIAFYFNNEKIIRTIKGLDLSLRITPENPSLQSGILIQCENDEEIENLKNWSPKKVNAEIFSEKLNGL
jgi:hypothetical protein